MSIPNTQNPSFASSNEFYQFFLLGSNDPAFGNGNAECLGVFDMAATAALRLLPSVENAFSPSYPFSGFQGGNVAGSSTGLPVLSSLDFQVPYSNQRDAYIFSFINLFVQMGGTSPSITFSSWLSPWSGQKY